MANNGYWNSSYAFGMDSTGGWGGRYFFSYFTELEDKNITAIVMQLIFFITTCLVSPVSNMMIGACVLVFPDMRTPANFYILNLAIAALLFSLTIPPVIYSRLNTDWLLGETVCKLVPYIQFATGQVMQWIPSLISIERRYCIIVPPFRSNLTPLKAALQLILLWLGLFVVCSPVVLWFREQETNAGQTICTFVVPKQQVYIAQYILLPVYLVLSLVPVAILFCNCVIICKQIIGTKGVWAKSCVDIEIYDPVTRHRIRRQSELSFSEIFTPFSRRQSLSVQEERRVYRHARVVEILFLNVIVVVAMWFCFTIIIIIIFVDSSRQDTGFFFRSRYFIDVLLTTFILSVVNPMIYGFLSDSYKVCVKKICCMNKDNLFDIRQRLDNGARNQGSFRENRNLSRPDSIPEGPGIT